MNVASSEVRALIALVYEGRGRSVGPACGPGLTCGRWLGCLCFSSRACEEGALCMMLSENTASGIPGGSLVVGPRGPAGPPALSGATHGPRGRWGAAAGGSPGCPAGGGVHALGGAPAPSCQSQLVPGLLGVCSSDLPVSLFF